MSRLKVTAGKKMDEAEIEALLKQLKNLKLTSRVEKNSVVKLCEFWISAKI